MHINILNEMSHSPDSKCRNKLNKVDIQNVKYLITRQLLIANLFLLYEIGRKTILINKFLAYQISLQKKTESVLWKTSHKTMSKII